MEYWEIFINGYKGYASYLWNEIVNPGWGNYFYWLIFGSLVFFAMELIMPWRKGQPKFRKDFWLDVFYMFFNFFLFSLIIYNAASQVIVELLNDVILYLTDFNLKASNPLNNSPLWLILLIGFFLRDFIQWWIHRLLHRVEWLWNFHKVHHSVEQMGFAAQLRYHWMENIVYRSIEYIPLALLGIGLHNFFIIHIFTFCIGHFNHSNITVPGKFSGGAIGLFLGILISTGGFDITLLVDSTWAIKVTFILGMTAFGAFIMGPYMKYIFNSPEMHIWHHAYDLPEERKYGVNFGLSLALWDYIWGTAYVPYDGRDIRLGFPGVEEFPDNFVDQNLYGLGKK